MKRRRALRSLGAIAAAVSLPLYAQPPAAVRRLGLLLLIPAPVLTDPFFAELEKRGWVRGRNLEAEIRVTAREQSRAAEMAKELLERRPDVLVVIGTANAVAAKHASSTVPIVMLGSGYPVESGLAASLARPGGNVPAIQSLRLNLKTAKALGITIPRSLLVRADEVIQ